MRDRYIKMVEDAVESLGRCTVEEIRKEIKFKLKPQNIARICKRHSNFITKDGKDGNRVIWRWND